jgi:RDD family
MACPSCGEICRCSAVVEVSSAPLREVLEAEISPAGVLSCNSHEPVENDVAAVDLQHQAVQESETSNDDSTWRQELSARLNRYHSRRKPRPPRYPSLQLKFEQPATLSTANIKADFCRTAASSNQAVAFDEIPSVSQPIPDPALARLEETLTSPDKATLDVASPAPSHSPGAKIIEFPRSWTPPAPPLDQLAGPVVTTPRILEAPEISPPPPALGGITIEPPTPPPIEKRPGIDIPLQSALLERRISAAAIDSVIVATACALFAFIFWKLTAIEPPRIQIVGVFTGLLTLFWSAYQYLLIIYAGTTPGLLLTHLELCRFDGTRAKRSLRRWRVLASFLSGASLGMGYLWVFLDEDSLCWHDRITHTYLAAKTNQNSRQTSPPVLTA